MRVVLEKNVGYIKINLIQKVKVGFIKYMGCSQQNVGCE